MKRNSLMQVSILQLFKFSKIITVTLLVGSLSSCSWMTERTSLFGEDGEQKAKTVPLQMVPKEQYDQLLTKYETLIGQVKSAEEAKRESVERPFEGGDPSEIVNQLSKVQPPSDLAETVDVFSEQKKMVDQNEAMLGKAQSAVVSDNIVENQIVRLRKAIELVGQNRFDQALNVFKDLEQSPVEQIQVRAKFYLGEILFMQNEYDLAMQVFEEIISKHAFSGVVIKSLGRLIVCTEKLKLDKKKEKYYSILHDFFGAA